MRNLECVITLKSRMSNRNSLEISFYCELEAQVELNLLLVKVLLDRNMSLF